MEAENMQNPFYQAGQKLIVEDYCKNLSNNSSEKLPEVSEQIVVLRKAYEISIMEQTIHVYFFARRVTATFHIHIQRII